MRTQTRAVIAPDFPESEWINSSPLRIDALLGAGPLLVEFWDHARINSLRTLPYTQAWYDAYREDGLSVVGIHASGFDFGNEPGAAAKAAARLAIKYPVLIDSDFRAWRAYGNRGWPARYLWGRGGALRYVHYGEGDYEDAELAIRESLTEYGHEREWGSLIPSIHPEDKPGITLKQPTAEIQLPQHQDRVELSGQWHPHEAAIESAAEDSAITVQYEAGAIYAVLSGEGAKYDGLHELGKSEGRIQLKAGTPGLKVHGFQFTPKI